MAHVIIIGGGMSGLSLAWYLKEMAKGWEITVLEAENRVGGKAWTEKSKGFLVERGVNGVLDNKPSTLELSRALGISPLRSNDASRKRFVVRSGRLLPLPDSPGAFLRSKILSLSGKLRLFYEPFIPPLRGQRDESLASFAKRRLGGEAYKYLIDPMASGIYAGNPERLSLKSCFPRIHELEKEYGSLIKAMIALKREARRKGVKKKASAGPGGVLTSFRGGMEELVNALRESLKNEIRTDSRVSAISLKEGNWEVQTENGEVFLGTHVVLSLPAHDARSLVKGLSKRLFGLFNHFEYPPIAVCALGFRARDISGRLDGFGFLCPHVESRKILGALWDSSVFDFRAPEGFHLIRCLLGGMRNRHILEKKDSEILKMSLGELKDLMGIKKEPIFAEVFRWKRAIPQYHIGYERLLEEIHRELLRYPRLFIRCNWVKGVSLNDCVFNSRELAGLIMSGRDEQRF